METLKNSFCNYCAVWRVEREKTKEGKLIISLNTFFWICCLDVTQSWRLSTFDSLTLCSRWETPGRTGLRGFWPLSLTPPGAMLAVGSVAGERLCHRAASCLLTPTAAPSLGVQAVQVTWETRSVPSSSSGVPGKLKPDLSRSPPSSSEKTETK